ncbi:flagellar hook protein FlgE [Paeniglutamicibacter sp. ABSL32-1]|jgi:flagellar hook protein FlgE|uniref:Flagellar hook protein FlgE n=1 Tax=Paeniglutamicibacter sulfureus TaxID=43666 RepID=A0ABU2BNT6_9MICC|nr:MULTISPECIES: flagellar hook protein FlgE [Paeniglutamicibacter]MBV1780013.1 flagellar hook protein FlgE [Paeniglutamicibacter quisquiliarum]MDO2935586.1 flagellar hook protein FlgE [Paeniglutamicibacter sulfureus]MDR7359946.1 flagellar hook protein FlgE [Paeniglutamicibacter sulfureus]
MLRSLYSGISGLRAHQTMLDTTGNNIANVNTSGFKSSSVQFQDTLSQMTQGATTPGENAGGRNPAQVGLGVQVAGISTNFGQGSAQSTGRSSDMMIAGEGFFATRSGNATSLTRSGAFEFDANGRLTSADGGIVQGWMAQGGQLATGGALTDVALPRDLLAPGVGTSTAGLSGNLPKETATGESIVQDKEIFAADGTSRTMTMTFTRTANGWNVAGNDGAGATGTATLALANDGTLNGGTMNLGGIAVDLSAVTGYAGLKTVSIAEQNGRSAGTLESYTLGSDGTLTGTFSNGAQQAIAQIALGSVANPGGLQKTGGSGYTVTANSGAIEYGVPGDPGMGTISGGMLEMSNVDLSQEFTNLIVAQRGFQANARIITTSDEVLQELANLKR